MKRNAVATIIVGSEAKEMSKYSLPLMENYSKTVHADFVILKKSNISTDHKKPMYEKYQISNLFGSYERILYLDCDILISPESPNIFRYVDPAFIGAVSVENAYAKVEHEKRSINNVLGEIKWINPYFNSGVMLLSEQHRSLFSETFNYIEKWERGKKENNIDAKNDQTLINYLTNYYKFNVLDIGKSFNYTRAFGLFHKRFSHYFIHYAGLIGNRSWQMERDTNALNSKIRFIFHKNLPFYTYILDRFNLEYIKQKL